MMVRQTVWVFVASGASFPGGIFSDEGSAVRWIASNGLSGVLTEYPVGLGVLDWALEAGHFRATKIEKLRDPSFVGRFTTAAQAHSHFDRGVATHAEKD
jgi:hypothetical protein